MTYGEREASDDLYARTQLENIVACDEVLLERPRASRQNHQCLRRAYPRTFSLPRDINTEARKRMRRGTTEGNLSRLHSCGALSVKSSLPLRYPPTCTAGRLSGSASACRNTSWVTGAVSPSPNST